MSDRSFYTALIEAQLAALRFQAPFLKAMGGAGASGAGSEGADSAEELRAATAEQMRLWQAMAAAATGQGATGASNAAGQTGFGAGMFDCFTSGPEFADIAALEQKILRTGKEWAEFQRALQVCQTIVAKAWAKAQLRFNMSRAKDAGDKADDPSGEASGTADETMRGAIDTWLEIAREELTNCLRSPPYLSAQAKAMKAWLAYKTREQALIEEWCEAHGVPTRTEVDDLHRLVDGLRRDIRALKQEKSASKKTSSKRGSRARG